MEQSFCIGDNIYYGKRKKYTLGPKGDQRVLEREWYIATEINIIL